MFNFKKSRAAKGFTLIELLVVVVIVGILAAVALPNFLGQAGKAKTTEATVMIDVIKTGQEAYLSENAAYFTDTTSGGVTAALFPTLPSSTMAGTLATTGASFAQLSSFLNITPDTTKFANGVAPTSDLWGIRTISLGATNFGIAVDSVAGSTTPGRIGGLAAAYSKTAGKVITDADQAR